MNGILQQPVFQITVPLMVTFVGAIWIASWSQNKRFDDIHRRLDEVIRRLERIEARLEDFEKRITRLEERTSIVRGR